MQPEELAFVPHFVRLWGGGKCNIVEEGIDVSFCRGQRSLREHTKKETEGKWTKGRGMGRGW